jgi:hypothetical protein
MAIDQYGKQIAPGQWKGNLTGHTFDSMEAMLYYEKRAAQAAHAKAAAPSPLDKLSTDQVRLVTEAFVGAIAEAEKHTSFNDEADIFLLRHPEFVNSQSNGTKMVTALTLMGKQHTATAHDMELAYETLRDANALELNEKALQQQRQAALEERTKEPAGEYFDEAAAYAMPMAQLERKVKGYL